MQRCLQLAALGLGNVAPNPMVGAVLVYQDQIIGEGYHQEYGKEHAEVNCINSVAVDQIPLISKSVLYVSLEPCSHFGKTPPCADLIIEKKIPVVVIACADIFSKVNGAGIKKLQDAGIKVITGVCENEAIRLNKRFFTFHQKNRPYIILKWAQSINKKIANSDFSRVMISNEQTNILVHQWRSEEAAIMVGTNTARYDNPSLSNRNPAGKNPVRIVIDMDLKLSPSLQLFNGVTKAIVFNKLKEAEIDNVVFVMVSNENLLAQIMNNLHSFQLQSVLIEGGAKLLQSFIDAGLWDEARIITNENLLIENGLAAPVLSDHHEMNTIKIQNDTICTYQPKNTTVDR